MERLRKNPASGVRAALIIAACVLLAVCLRRFLLPVVKIALAAAGLAVIISPVCRFFEKKFSRGISAVMAVVSVAAVIAAAFFAIAYLAVGFSGFLQETLASAMAFWEKISSFADGFAIDISGAGEKISALAMSMGGKFLFAVGNTISGAAGAIISAVICVFILKDREIILLKCEMMSPLRFREKAVVCAISVYSDITLYIRAQLIICLCVGILSALGLAVIGVPYGILLGLLAGIFNIIPYLGPIIACIPVGLAALTGGIYLMAMAIIVMIAVQQIDGLIISPRIMGSVTGIPSPVIMIAIYCAGGAFGILGMLMVMPCLILFRTCVRVFVESGVSH